MRINFQFLEISPFEKNFQKIIEKKIRHVFKLLKRNKKELTIIFTNDKVIQVYNWQFLKRNYPTNVLAFQGEGNYLGDIIISVEKVKEEVITYSLPYEDYLLALILHGILHLYGYDHEK
ncbi:MAG: rRNA maturation RNase YbeY, partial [Caldimicrobium sp.]